jgi:hypothetical protein
MYENYQNYTWGEPIHHLIESGYLAQAKYVITTTLG